VRSGGELTHPADEESRDDEPQQRVKEPVMSAGAATSQIQSWQMPTGTASTASSQRYQLLLLHTLVSVSLSYQLLFSQEPLVTFEVLEYLVLGLAMSVGALMAVPARYWGTGWLVGTVVVADTLLTSTIIFLSGNAGNDLYLTYVLIILIAAYAPSLKEMLILSVILCAAYGAILFLGSTESNPVREEHLLRIPVLLIMAAFYGAATERARIDIAKRKRAEDALRMSAHMRQSQKMEAIGRLAGGIAHDFNNLLTVITGYGDRISDRLGHDHPLRGDAQEIKDAAERAAALTHQLLAFSRKQVLQPKVFYLDFVVANLDKMLRRLIGEDIELITLLKPELGKVKADPGQIEQVIINLAINARDAMPNGGKLTIETANVELDESDGDGSVSIVPGRYVMLAVSDTGIGMDQETQSHLFEPFFTTKLAGKGTGLGLSTVYGIVKQSGGYIFVHSELGHGATFKIYLPRVEEKAEALAPVVPSGEPVKGWETVLLVEDERRVRTIAAGILEANGYTVLEAGNGEEAIELSQNFSGQIHLLVTDVVMPRMSGQELAEHLMAVRPTMKVLFISGYADRALGKEGILRPGAAFLQKPFASATLARKVREVLDAPTCQPSVATR